MRKDGMDPSEQTDYRLSSDLRPYGTAGSGRQNKEIQFIKELPSVGLSSFILFCAP